MITTYLYRICTILILVITKVVGVHGQTPHDLRLRHERHHTDSNRIKESRVSIVSKVPAGITRSPAILDVQRRDFQQRLTLFALVMLAVIAGITYHGYRNKKRSNFELQYRQIEINKQNAALKSLVAEKDNILAEKDMLLKEVHHRVKNNLQIVVSLLNTQAAFLKNRAALAAVSDSQDRVHAIALIHQKLYGNSSVSNIDMPTYVSDLVHYLSDRFETVKKGIRFTRIIPPLEMKLTQAVPIGLILNEAITNAIKYAFNKANGEITIALKLLKRNQVLLTLSDNGKGLAPDFNMEQVNTLGMEMMKALSKQLDGEIRITNESGVCISITFELEKLTDEIALDPLFTLKPD